MSTDTALARYPRTSHLPWSQAVANDDRVIPGLDALRAGPLVVTEKMDGGNYTLTRDASYARSVTSNSHPWDGPAKAVWARVRADIPAGWRISGESVWAQRSVAYRDLPGPFLVFGIWDDTATLLSWDDTEQWAQLLGLPLVRVLYRGASLEDAAGAWASSGLTAQVSEGYVVRRADPIRAEDFPLRVAKWVRAGHVQTSDDWRHRDDQVANGFAPGSWGVGG